MYDFIGRIKHVEGIPLLPEKQFYSARDSYIYKFKMIGPAELEYQIKCEPDGYSPSNNMVRGCMRFDNDDLLAFGEWIVRNVK